jgi:uncharacterized protein
MRPYGLALLASLAGIGCTAHPAAQPRPVVRMVRNTAMSERLAAEYARALPNVEFKLVDAVGSVNAIDAIQRGDADVGFAFADVAYLAQARAMDDVDARRHELRGIAALHVAPIHLLARAGLRITGVGDLRRFTVGTGEVSSGQERLADLIFRAYGIAGARVHSVAVVPDSTADALESARVDAAFVTGYYPLTVVSDATRRGARLVPIAGEAARRLMDEYPFVRDVVIPANTYAGQPDSIRTIGVDRLLVCRREMDERLVHDLTQQFLDALPRIPAFFETSLRLMDLEQASATPIPLHAGAALYYREREVAR